MHSTPTDAKEIRKFGGIGFVFFGSLAGIALWRDRPWAILIFGLLALLSAGFMAIPLALAPVYALWLRVAHAIGTGVTVVMLTLAFYLVITPSGLLKRLISGTPIPMKPDKTADSYWVPREASAQPKERFLKRF